MQIEKENIWDKDLSQHCQKYKHAKTKGPWSKASQRTN